MLTNDIKTRIKRLSKELSEGLLEREDAIKICLLSALAGENIFILGAPGIAKSLIARRLADAFKDVTHFEYLMTRFSTPEEIFGPLSIDALKNEGKYIRLTEGYLPKAEIVFLDEIWKSGNAILNTLLTVINEHKFRNGDKEITIPMRTLITASNELPEANSGLEALYDRMLVRLWLDPIKSKNNFQKMLQGTNQLNKVSEDLKISLEEYENWQKQIDDVTISDEVFDDLYKLKSELAEINNITSNKKEDASELDNKQKIKTIQNNDQLYISDRRWKKAFHFLKACAFFNGRKKVEKIDLLLLKDCLWHDVHSRYHVNNKLNNYATQNLYKQNIVMGKLAQITTKCHKLSAEILHDIGIKVRTNNIHIPLITSQYHIDKHLYEMDFSKKSQTLVFLDECHLNPENLEDITLSATIETHNLKKWLKHGGEVYIRLDKGPLIQLNLALDSDNYLIAKEPNGKIIQLTLQKKSTIPSWQKDKWKHAVSEIENDLEEIRNQIKKIEENLKLNESHIFLNEETLVTIADSIHKLQTNEQLALKRLNELTDKLHQIADDLTVVEKH